MAPSYLPTKTGLNPYGIKTGGQIRRVDPLFEKLKELSGGKILDIATGHGAFLDLMINSFNDFDEAVGIDISVEVVEAAQERFPEKYRFEVMDAEQLQFDDDYFDTVAIRHSLHHLRHVNIVLGEMKRVLKPGGLFIFCEVFQSPDILRSNSQRYLHHWWAEVDRARGIYHNETFTKVEILDFVRPLNFDEVEIIEHYEELDQQKEIEILASIMRKCDMYIEKLRNLNGYAGLIRKGEELRNRIETQGITPERILYVLGRK
jgi:ubiquinone/menaquinone biosynthesis C-methylase UbiE